MTSVDDVCEFIRDFTFDEESSFSASKEANPTTFPEEVRWRKRERDRKRELSIEVLNGAN